jgi:hypothetical protein
MIDQRILGTLVLATLAMGLLTLAIDWLQKRTPGFRGGTVRAPAPRRPRRRYKIVLRPRGLPCDSHGNDVAPGDRSGSRCVTADE